MRKKAFIILIVIVALLGIGAYFLYKEWKRKNEKYNKKKNQTNPTKKEYINNSFNPQQAKIPAEKSNLINKRNVPRVILRRSVQSNDAVEFTSVASVPPGESFGIFEPKAKNATIRAKINGIEYQMLRLISSPYISIDANNELVTFYVPVKNVKAVPISKTQEKQDTNLTSIAKEIYYMLRGWTSDEEYKKINKIIRSLTDDQVKDLIKVYKEEYNKNLYNEMITELHGGELLYSINRINYI